MIEIKSKEFCFVIDADGKQLAPTTVNRGWYLIRKNKAKLVERFPLVIQLNRVINNPICNIICGIDDGSKFVGVALVQKCQSKNKCIFKGTIYQRQDVKKLMTSRAEHRRYRRSNKRYRKARWLNRASSKRKGRLSPTILQKKQAIIRFINKIKKWVDVSKIILEDVVIDIRAMTDGYKPYRWLYQKSNRLDENLRKATIIRDGKCMLCNKNNLELHAHHIVPRRMCGADTLSNLITLCYKCHDSINNKETDFIEIFQSKIKGKTIRFDYAQHVMQGKYWLRRELGKIAELEITNGGDTANRRNDWNIEKTHANDAISITGLYPNVSTHIDKEIKPKRKKRKMKCKDDVCGFRHGDYVNYTDTKGITWFGYITAMYLDKKQINIQSKTKHLKRVNATKSIFVYRCLKMSII